MFPGSKLSEITFQLRQRIQRNHTDSPVNRNSFHYNDGNANSDEQNDDITRLCNPKTKFEITAKYIHLRTHFIIENIWKQICTDDI